MPTRINQEQMQRLARLGAKARVEELRRELDALTRAFPDLAGGDRGTAGGRRGAARRSAAAGRPRRRMSSAARRAVSERMKRYWAERRKEKGAKRG